MAKRSVTITAAWITSGATLIAALIGALVYFRPVSRLPKLTMPDYSLMLSKPVVNPDSQIEDRHCVKPPSIELVANCTNCLEKDAIETRCGKPRLHQEGEFPYVPKENLFVEEQLGGHRLVARLDTAPFILSHYPRSPHGLYQMEFKVFDPSKPYEAVSKIEFNYIYKEDFRNLSKAILRSDKEFRSITQSPGGLEIRNLSQQGYFVSGDLNQEFDFKTNFYICGFFTIEFQDPHNPSGLDIAFCDRWGEKLCVVFADGRLDTFSIKMADDKYGDNGVTIRSSKISIGRTVSENPIYNFFKIWIWEHEGESRCTLYVQRNSPVFTPESCVYERKIDTSRFLGKFTRIKLKLWKSGVVKLYDLEVGEVPKR
jgi:hypothetical protein